MTQNNRYLIYCDESNIHSARYMLIGGIWLPLDLEITLRAKLKEVRQNYNMTAEFKWTKVSQAKLPAYYAWVDCFFSNLNFNFRCIVIDTSLLDYQTYHKSDQELGFYKFYYQVVSRNIQPEDLYWLYTDERNNRKKNRLEVLRIVTNRYWKKKADTEPLRVVEPRSSHDEDILQLTDVLLGAIGYTWNGFKESPVKLDLIQYIAKKLEWPSLHVSTPPYYTRFNIWQWRPSLPPQVKSKRPHS